MKIEKSVNITISQDEIETLIKNHLKKSRIQLSYITYEYERSELTIHCSGIECESENDVNYNRGYVFEPQHKE